MRRPKPALSKDGGVTLLTARKSNRASNSKSPGETSRGTKGPYAATPSSPDCNLSRQRLPLLGYNCPTQWCCTARGVLFYAGFITPDNHEAHSAQIPLATAFQWPFPIGSHLYRISPKGSYQLVYHAEPARKDYVYVMGYRARRYRAHPHNLADSGRLKRRGSHPYYG